MKLLLILTSILILGCSPQKRLNRKYKKLTNFAKKHNLLRSDSILVRDTVVVSTIKKDTIFSKETFYERLRDTIIINNDRLTIREYYNSTTDSIIIEGECLGDTIPVEIPVYIDRPVVTEKVVKVPWWIWLLGGFLLLIGVGSLVRK